MGEVYRAHDLKLGSRRGIQVLPVYFRERSGTTVAGSEREARLLASLNHPHIGAIYGLEQTDGINGSRPRAGRRPDAGHWIVTPRGAGADQGSAQNRTTNRGGAGSSPRKRDHPSRSQAGQHQTYSVTAIVKVLDFGLAKAFLQGT